MASTRTVKRGLAAIIGTLVLADLGGFYKVSQFVQPLTVNQALARFRSSASTTAPAGSGPARPAAVTVATAPLGSAPSSRPPIPAGPAPTAASPRSAPVAPAAPVAASRGPAVAGPAVAAPQSPAPGVYVFATSGYETVSALGGSRHDYPSQTTITFSNSGCGQTMRWDGLQQRWDQYQLCLTPHGLEMQSFTTYHDFFGQVDQRTYQCDPNTYLDPANHSAGFSFAGRCSSGGGAATAALAGKVLGAGTVAVGGTQVPAVHIQVQETLAGATKGSRSHDMWFALSNSLPLVFNSLTDCQTQTSFGYTAYHEQVTLNLTSLQPLH